MSYWTARSGNVASSSKENRISKRNSEIPVINLDNLDKYLNRGFIDGTNIQQEEYTERADEILIKLQEDNKDQEKPEEKRRKF